MSHCDRSASQTAVVIAVPAPAISDSVHFIVIFFSVAEEGVPLDMGVAKAVVLAGEERGTRP